MRFTVRRKLSLPLSFGLVFLFLSPALALSLRPATFDEIRRNADVVIAATVRSLTSEKTSEPHLHGVQTRMNLEQVEVLAGGADITRFDVILPGGMLENGLRVQMPGAPVFKPNERVVLFLRSIDDGELALVGHGLGVLRCSSDGKWVLPEVCAENGPPREGESYTHLIQRLRLPLTAVLPAPPAGSAVGANPNSSWQASGWLKLLVAVLAGLLLVTIYLLRRHRRAIPIVLAVVALALVYGQRREAAAEAAEQRAFELLGSSWDLTTELPGRVTAGRVLWVQGKGTPDLSDDVAFAIIQAQFQQWEDIAESAIAFRKNGLSQNSGQSINARNIMSFLADGSKKIFDSLTLAVTFMISNNDTPSRFVDTDTIFNNRNIVWLADQGNYALDVVALHEIGHILGLDHTNNSNNVMFPTARGHRTFGSGDRAGAAVLYPIVPTDPPLAFVAASPKAGSAPLTVSFSSADSVSRINSALTRDWDFGDGTPISHEISPAHIYAASGTFTATLSVTDINGTATTTVPIIVGVPGEAMIVKKLGYKIALSMPLRNTRGKDKIALTLRGVNLQSGDELRVMFGAVELTNGQSPLDSRLGFKGLGGGDGMLRARYNSRKHELTLNLNTATLSPALDPRAVTDSSSCGATTTRIIALIFRTDGALTAQSADASYSFAVKTGKTPNGVIEKTLQAKN
ncbi:MAG: PKD domain-containing protein [Planctomycetota bacterium]